jgi:hypothetical protein
MCVKNNVMVRFFAIVNMSNTIAPIVLGIKKNTPYIESIYEANKNSAFIKKKDIENLGFSSSSDPKVKIIPMDVPKSFFLN